MHVGPMEKPHLGARLVRRCLLLLRSLWKEVRPIEPASIDFSVMGRCPHCDTLVSGYIGKMVDPPFTMWLTCMNCGHWWEPKTRRVQ